MSFENQFNKKNHQEKAQPESVKDSLISKIASKLHNQWREARRIPGAEGYGSGIKFESRMKNTKDKDFIFEKFGNNEIEQTGIDIANTDYEYLPKDWRGENLTSAQVAVEIIQKELGEDFLKTSLPISEDFIERASEIVHHKWRERNEKSAEDNQKVSYGELSEEEKDKDRDIVIIAIDIYNNLAQHKSKEV